MRILTIGFTRKTAQQFFERLRDAGAARVVDVRLNNASQLAGFTKKSDLPYLLRQVCGIGYLHEPQLAPTQALLDSYGKRAGNWEAYERAFLQLMQERRIEDAIPQELIADSCLLCSEPTPNRCHRRLVAEYLQSRWPEVEVHHL